MSSTLILRCVAALGIAFCIPCLGQEVKSEFGIREDQPRTGSIIKQYAVRGTSIPINKSYGELTDEKKATLCS
jgi:hypothetical protein